MADDMVPEGQTTPLTNENWHRVVGILMLKFGVIAVEILPEDVMRLGNGMAVFVDVTEPNRFVVRVMPEEIFEQYKKEKGGITT